jgi:hypothetical protein
MSRFERKSPIATLGAARNRLFGRARPFVVALAIAIAAFATTAQATQIAIRYAGDDGEGPGIVPSGEIVLLDNDLNLIVPDWACGVRLEKPFPAMWDEGWGFNEISAGGIGGYMDGVFGNGAESPYLQVIGPIGGCAGEGNYNFDTPATGNNTQLPPAGSGSIVMDVDAVSHVYWLASNGSAEPAEIPENEEPPSIEEICEETPEFCPAVADDITICFEVDAELMPTFCPEEDDHSGQLVDHFASASHELIVVATRLRLARNQLAHGNRSGAESLLRMVKTSAAHIDTIVKRTPAREAKLTRLVMSLTPTASTAKRIGTTQSARSLVQASLAQCRKRIDGLLVNLSRARPAQFDAAAAACTSASAHADEAVDNLMILRSSNLPSLTRGR